MTLASVAATAAAAALFVQLGRCVTVCTEAGVCLQNLRVRTVGGTGLALSFGKLPGSLCSKYMLVDGEKVAFGSYRWVSAPIRDASWSWSCWDAPSRSRFDLV